MHFAGADRSSMLGFSAQHRVLDMVEQKYMGPNLSLPDPFPYPSFPPSELSPLLEYLLHTPTNFTTTRSSSLIPDHVHPALGSMPTGHVPYTEGAVNMVHSMFMTPSTDGKVTTLVLKSSGLSSKGAILI